jgi:hypothetical protein
MTPNFDGGTDKTHSIGVPNFVSVELMEKVDEAIKALSEKAGWGEPHLLELLAVIALVRADDAREILGIIPPNGEAWFIPEMKRKFFAITDKWEGK